MLCNTVVFFYFDNLNSSCAFLFGLYISRSNSSGVRLQCTLDLTLHFEKGEPCVTSNQLSHDSGIDRQRVCVREREGEGEGKRKIKGTSIILIDKL